MELISDVKDNFIIAKASGKIDATNAGEFTELLLDLFKNKNRVVLDFEKVDYVSSAGLRSVLIAAKEAQSRNGVLVICSLQEQIYEIFEMTGFTEMLKVVSSTDEAVKIAEDSIN
jgi:anti-sigma B factor antagonist